MEQRLPQGVFRGQETQLRSRSRKLPSDVSPDSINSHFDPHSEDRFFESTPGPEFYALDTMPTPSDEFLLQKLLERHSRSRKKSTKLLAQLEQALKSGLHVFQFWTSTNDNAGPPASTVIYIYLTVDQTVYPFLYHSSDGDYELTIKNFIVLLNSPLVQYADPWATVCANLGWKSGTFKSPLDNSEVNAYDYLDDWSGYFTEAYLLQARPVEYCFLPTYYKDNANFSMSIYAFPIREFIRFVQGSVFTGQYIQDYLDAAESQIQNESNLIEEQRLVAGWHLGFYAMMGMRVPDNFNPDVDLADDQIVFGEGILPCELQAENLDYNAFGLQGPVSRLNLSGFRNVKVVLLIDVYQSYVYSSTTKVYEDLQLSKLRVRRDSILIDPNPQILQQMRATIPIPNPFGDQIPGLISPIFQARQAGTYGKYWIFPTIQQINLILTWLGHRTLQQTTFKTVPSGQTSQPSSEQFNDPQQYKPGTTQAYDFSK